MNQQEAYEILGISSDPEENIKKAYLRLSRENHPDKGGDPQVFLKIQKAYECLTQVQEPAKNRQDVIDVNVQISLEEAIFGVTLEVHLKPQVISSTPLIDQNGVSRTYLDVVTIVEKIPPLLLVQLPSFSFLHKGKVIMGCERTLKINYSVKEHERYKLHKTPNCMVSVEEIVPVTVALYGGVIEVKTLYGIRKVAIKAGTNVGDIYYVKNHGPLGCLAVIVSGFKMPVVKDLEEATDENQKLVDDEEQELIANEQKAKELNG